MRLFYALRSIRNQGVHKDVLDFIKDNNEWMLDNETVLPQKAAENWHSVRHNVLSLGQKESKQDKMADGPERSALIEDIIKKGRYTDELIKEAEQLIRDELGLKPFKIHHPGKTAGSSAS